MRWTAFKIMTAVCFAGPCLSETINSIGLGDGVKVMIETSSGWQVSSVPNPALAVAEVRKMLDDAREIRLQKSGTRVLVSTMKMKSGLGPPKTYDGAAIVKAAAGQYLSQAKQREVVVSSRVNGDIRVAFVTLEAREGQRFNVRAGYPGGCVSTGNIHRGSLVVAISIASESCTSASHEEALSAFLGAQL